MKVTIKPSVATGSVQVPPSKSVAHRALICGALTDGCRIENCGTSQDIEATLRCLSALGAQVSREGAFVKIGGLNPGFIPENAILDCGESGSTLRFLLPLCLLSNTPVTLKGQGRLLQRPMEVYESLCREHGFLYEKAPQSITVCGRLNNGYYAIPGDVSSQFVTGMLFALSLLPGESRLEVTGRLESASYVEITLAVLSAFGVDISRENNVYLIRGNAVSTAQNYVVEGDCSNAAYIDAFNLLGGDVKVLGLSRETPQGDWVYKNIFADFFKNKREFDLSDCPDLGPVLFALAAALGGAKFTGAARLRIKESDRCRAMTEELSKFGINAEIGDNHVIILPGKVTKPTVALYGHNDHRVVMALSLLCSITGGTILGAEAVAKSYPNFFDDIASIGINLTID